MDAKRNVEMSGYDSLDGMWFMLREIEQIKNGTTDWELRMQFLESHLLLIMASGKGRLTIDGRFIELRQGSVYVCAPGQLVEAAVDALDERGFFYVRFDVSEDSSSADSHVQLVKRDSRFPVKGEIIASSPVSISVLCETICRCFGEQDRLQRFRSQIYFQELLYILLQDALLIQDSGTEVILEYMKSYIEEHYQDELTIEHLAKVAGISSRHFMRLFKKRVGCSAIDYLAIFRIKQAQQLMRKEGEHRLKDIARHVGYQDDIYFRRKFKHITGVPPAAFMKSSRQKIIAYHSLNIGQLIALQITPYAAPSDHPWTDYYRRKYQTDSVLPLSSNETISREELRRAAPDYIIGIDSFVSAGEQAKLGEIAPSFFVPWLNNNWREHLCLIAQFLDKNAEAEVWLENYENKARFVREQVKSVIKEDSLLILRISGDRYNVLGSRSLDAVFYDDLHIVPAHGIDRNLSDQLQYTAPDLLANFDADRILLIVDEDALSQTTRQTLQHSQPWSELKAVRNKRVDFLPAYPWLEYNAFTHELLLDEALKLWRDRA
ncbi:helix-turn-helix domain-containing protein [Paenibacillus eucommiae]|uniref:ABC-type Fe3+-hydroxamate transport system substrate-binding protein n=1 Tax=Paenibacillus eucommiae TaxID=1355755 RepID=A0ABS4IRY5_9BACL|nr:helix-turn-helix domain-containing protein [Paenibacillus eucommiae]MBP1989890.1 ABC-type Fe3+-hydroxamate transport system substrate-binding protein [Paenibacillus eucommiae]